MHVETKQPYHSTACSTLQVELAFPPIYINVDQLFSGLSVAIQRSGCLTWKDLLKLLRVCYKQTQGDTTDKVATIQYAPMDQNFAIRKSITPHIIITFGSQKNYSENEIGTVQKRRLLQKTAFQWYSKQAFSSLSVQIMKSRI